MVDRHFQPQHVFLLLLFAIGCGVPAVDSSDSSLDKAQTNAPVVANAEAAAAKDKVAEAAAAVEAVEFIAPPLTAQEIQQGWISLFDGCSLFGWDVPTVSN